MLSALNLRNVLALFATFFLIACRDSGDEPPMSSNEIAESDINMKALPRPPVAKKIPHVMEAHQDTRVDDYYWMRDDERKDPEVIAYLEAENAYTNATLAHIKDVEARLFEEIIGRIEKNDDSVPARNGNHWYYRRFEADKEYPIHARKKTLDAAEEVTLDVNQLAMGMDYFSAAGLVYSPDEKLLAYGEDTVSRRIYTIKIKDLETGEMLDDKLEEANPSVAWANDNQTLFYVKKDLQTLLGNKIYRHKLGTPQSDDVLVYDESNNQLYISVTRSDDGSAIVIQRGNSTSSSALFLDASTPDGNFTLFHPHETFVQYSIQPSGDAFFVRTSKDAINFQVFKVSKDAIDDMTQWELIIPHREDVFLESLEVFDDHLAAVEKKNGLNDLVIYNLAGSVQRTINFDDAAYTMGFSNNPIDETGFVRISYSSLTTPDSIIDINMNSSEQTLKKQDKVLGDFDPSHYFSERFFVSARDGKQIPVSLVYRKNLFKKDGSNPLYQYGYGSYGSNVGAGFRSHSLSLLDRGFVFAIAHIRGSATMGRQWYEDGKLLNKKNTFTDFIDVTRALIEQKYSSADRIIAAGGSAGGLLIGAVANMAPELYFGLSAHVPFVDVVTTMSDPSIPLTTNEYTEWGNPADKEYYDYILSYSPYDQVKTQDYPHMFVTTGLYDSQVQYFEPSKWLAKLRDKKTDNNYLLFDINMEAGHGGASGRFRRYEIMAREYAFYFDLLKVKEVDI